MSMGPLLALDLEMNTSGKIIQVGACVGHFDEIDNWDANVTHQAGWIVNPNEEIDPRITQLTGITTQMAQVGVPLDVAYKELVNLAKQAGTFINVVTWGGADSEILRSQISPNLEWFFGRRWIDVKTIYTYECLVLGKHPAGGLEKSMRRMGLKFIGTPHNAAHDAFNTMKFLVELTRRRRAVHSCIKSAGNELMIVK
jgi:inhibitor of KinA sporulation pathway (predicted exonuclease)